MNGVIYCRVSSKEQVAGTSLESQELACREYAARSRIDISKVFIEKGESAKFADRTQLLELMEFCRHKENSVRALLVWKIDRLARNVGDHFNIKASLLKQDVRVVSVTEPIDENPEGKLLETILAGFAQFDNDLRATRTVQGMSRKIQEGIFPWKPPLGYATVNQPGNKKTKPDQPDQPVFGLLQRVWNEFATGAYTKAEILRLATAWGVRTKKGAPLSKQSLGNMLSTQFYAGIIRDPWSGKEHPGRHLPLVSREIFSQVQAVIARRNHSVRHERVRPEFPLRMFVRCSECKHYLTGGFSRGRSKYYPYYHCFNRTCPTLTYRRSEVVHQEFLGLLASIAPDRKAIDRVAEQVIVAARNRSKASGALKERRRLEIERLEEQQQQLINMRMEKLITDEEFLAQRLLLTQRRLELQSSGAGTALDEEHVMNQLDEICEPLANLAATWVDISPALKQRFQRLILPAGFVVGRVGTADLGCLFSTFRASEDRESNLVPPTGQFWNQLVEEIQAFAELLRGTPDLGLAA
jgi:DNA invertase Pin-like site-specific DNA recombinase